jgi:YD repeat-containing protein
MKFLLFLLLACQPLLAQSSAPVVEGPRFNEKGQQSLYLYSDGSKDTYVYDASGRMVKYFDRKGSVTMFRYGSDGSITVVHPDGSTN